MVQDSANSRVADEHPEAEVIGVDLSAIQPSHVPPNITFQIDDLELPWTFGPKFDFIHSCMMTGSFADWPRFFKQAYNNLNPDGFLEVIDILPLRSDDNTFLLESALLKWGQMMVEGCKKFSHPLDTARDYASQMRATSFKNITEKQFKWPQNNWPDDPKMKELGIWTYTNVVSDLSGLNMAVFMCIFKWTPEELEVFLVDMRNELRNKSVHAYFPMCVFFPFVYRPANELNTGWLYMIKRRHTLHG